MKNETVSIERTYPAPIEKVWDAITDPQQMRQWYFPMMEDFRPEPGFQTKIDVVAGGKHFLHLWKVVEVVPGKKISYEWRYEGYPGNSLVSFELFEASEGTKLVLTHEKLETFQGDQYPELGKDNFLQGWTMFIGANLKNYLDKTSGPVGETGMLIRKPVSEVFEAFSNPAITTKFWFTGSTGKLGVDAQVTWKWDMYEVTSYVDVKAFVPNEKITIEWGAAGQKRSFAEWRFEPLSSDTTFVTIEMWGFTGDTESICKQVSDSVGGFSWVLAGLKAYLEHALELNLIADRFPKGK